ncbi:LuxR C-terminal-related transcriptional regulator [Dactylosporangium sp. CA-139066]|uniref:LuxR C-terminal-related transcriptional regulator n=1 Tax=Dactylosporangium sp. CA-139066 TaxID=3239930 RepID=UPI003D8B20BC
MLEYLGLDATAEGVYRLMLANPDWGVARLADELDVEPKQIHAALDELFELSLLRESVERDGHFRPVSPGVGLQSLIARQQADLDRRQQQIAESQAAMAAMVAEFTDRQTNDRPADVEHVIGMDMIQRRLEDLAESVRVEALSIMPTMQTPEALTVAMRNNTGLLARGVTIRTAMQDCARNDKPTLAYAQSLTDAGAEVRTVPVLPPRMLVSDRSTAIVPIDPADTRAGVLVLTGRGVVASLVALFEQVWNTAVPLGASKARDRQGVTAQERELLNLLAQGHTDESAAKRLGVSERTCRRMMADLMERLGARSRFEAGLLAAREGWL